MINQDIINILKFHGYDNPLKRKHLLLRLKEMGYDITDREMRRICAENIPVCSSEKGYYIPQDLSELMKFKEFLEKKAIPLFTRFKAVKKAYCFGRDVQLEFNF